MTSLGAGPHVYLALGSLSVRDELTAIARPGDDRWKLLVSYWLWRTGGPARFSPGCRENEVELTVEAFPDPPAVFADSGAFSAGMAGHTIDLDDYVAWVRRNDQLLEVVCNVDVVDYRTKWADPARDAAATWDNQRRLEDMLQRDVLPVFHTGEPWEYLERYCDTYRYVALGGMYGAAGVVFRWLVRCFQIAAQTGTRFHGFGMSRQRELNALPWYSADASTWAQGQRFGAVTLWTGRKLTSIRVGNHQQAVAHARVLRDHGINPDDIADRRRYHQRHAIQAGAVAWRRYEQWLRAHHGPIPLAPLEVAR